MPSLRKYIRLGLKSVLTIIVGALLLPIVRGYISDWLSGKELWLLEEFIRLCDSYWKLLAVIFAVIVAVWVYDWTREKKNEFAKIWALHKPVDKLTPEDLRIQKYRKARILRKSDTTIENLLRNGRHVLITGKPKIGKTRSSYEAIRKLEGFSVIKPRPEEIGIEKIKIPPLSNKNFILFLDELQRFVDKNIDDVIDALERRSRKLIIVATCRTGVELDLLKERNLPLYREFANIELGEISKNDGRRLAEDIRKEYEEFMWKPEQFDGTPGSVTLDLEDMKERYKKAGDCRVILKALKLLKEGNLFLYKETRVKDVCLDVFELPTELLRRYAWEEMINSLKESDFITREEDVIDVYPSYLDICVYDYDPQLSDFMKVKDILVRSKDSGSLFYLGNGFYYKKDFRHARDCYQEALGIYPEYASAHNSLGYVFAKLGELEERKGLNDEAERLYNEAQEEHRRAISISPFYAVDHNNLGFALASLGEIKEIKGEYDEATRLFEEAEEEHREAIRLNPEYASAHHSLAYVLGKMGEVEEAEKEYREAIRLNPESPFPHNLLGHLLAKLGRYEEAEKEYREAIGIKSDYPSARNNLGYLLAKLGRYEEAEKEYGKAIEASPDYPVVYVNISHLLSDQERYDEAEGVCKKALRINPNYAEALNALGYALVNLKRYGEAEKAYRDAIHIRPAYAEAHKNLGYLLTEVRMYNEAAKEYRKALRMDPNDEDTVICLGILLERMGKDKAAEDCYEKVIESNPNSIKARTTYGYFLSFRGREDEAIDQFEEVVRMSPENVEAHGQLGYLHRRLPYIHANRARALIRLGRLNEAELEVREAIRLSPSNPFARKTLGTLLEERGDKADTEDSRLAFCEEAEKEYRKAIRLQPDYPSAHRHLANTLAKLGRYEEAEREYKETRKVVIKGNNPNYPKNNRDFGIFLSKIGRKKEAIRELRIAVRQFRERGNEEDAKNVEELIATLTSIDH